MFFTDRFDLPPGLRRREFFSRDFAARRDLYVHHDSVSARGNRKRSVFDVRGFLAKNRAEQTFFRRQFSLALRSDFTDQDITRLHLRAHSYYAVGTQVAKGLFAD